MKTNKIQFVISKNKIKQHKSKIYCILYVVFIVFMLYNERMEIQIVEL